MKKETEKIDSYTIHENGDIGEVQIADHVVAIIAGIASTEVKGVAAMSSNITNELVAKLGMKNLSKGVRVTVEEDSVIIDLALTLEYGYSIPETSRLVQEKVQKAIENMTGLKVREVNIRITGVNMSKE
ncbi:MAG TPA: Asp23/Gls24 family envelope stress response protein [Clostridiales bacterium]|nr:Asp23/Gls24 family envelope stress response protein [Clostridiales bacterium]